MIHKNLLRAWSLALALTTVAFLGAGCGGKDNSGPAQDPGVANGDEEAMQGEALVGVTAGKFGDAAVEAAIATVGSVISSDPHGTFYRVQLKDGVTLADASSALSSPDVVYVEPNYVAHPLAVGTPNEAVGAPGNWSNQYKQLNTGTVANGLVQGELQTAWSNWTLSPAIGWAYASGTIDLTGVTAANSALDTVTVNGVLFTSKSAPFTLGADDNATATNLKDGINASNNALLKGIVVASCVGGTTCTSPVITVTSVYPGVGGNSLTLAKNATPSISGANLSGGVGAASGAVAASASVTVTATGIADNTEKVTLNGIDFVARTSPSAANEFAIGTTVADAAGFLAKAINASTTNGVAGKFRATSAAGVVTITAIAPGVGGNSNTLNVTGAHLSRVIFAGGAAGAITVAVVDTGIQATHEDLQNKVLGGWNVIAGAATPIADSDPAFTGHGTQVAGVVAAEINNAKGIAGIAAVGNVNAGANVATDLRVVQLVPVKVSDATHVATHASIAAGINWAVNTRVPAVNVVLVSLGSGLPSYTLQKAIESAWAKGVLVVAAAGNSNTSLAKYPAAYQGSKQKVLSVASVDATDTISTDSNYGAWVNVAAPGESVYTTDSANDTAYKLGTVKGTSFSAAFAAGSAALVWTAYPGLTNDALRTILMQSVDPINLPKGKVLKANGGRLNVQLAMVNAANTAGSNDPLVPLSLNFDKTYTPIAGSFSGTITLTGAVTANAGQVVNLSSSAPAIGAVSAATITIPKGASSGTFKVSALTAGTTTVTATVGSNSLTYGLTVAPPGILSIALDKGSITGGTTVHGTVTMNVAVDADTVIAVTSDTPLAVADVGNVTVLKGKTSVKFDVPTLAVTSNYASTTKPTPNPVTLTATLSGKTKTTSLDVLAPAVVSVVFAPASTIVWDSPSTSTTGRGVVQGTVTLSGSVKIDTDVLLTPADFAVAVPGKVTVTAGTATATFNAQPEAVAAKTSYGVAASIGAYDVLTNPGKTGTFSVSPALASFSVSPSSVNGTGTVTGTVTLAANAPTDTIVAVAIDPASCAGPGALGADSAGVYFAGSPNTCSSSVTVKQGQKTATITVNSQPVAVPVAASVTASLLGLDKSATVTSNAPTLASIALDNAAKNVAVGNVLSGTVTLSGAAVATTKVHLVLASGGVATAEINNSNSFPQATTSVDVTISAGSSTGAFWVKGKVAGSDTINATVLGSAAVAKTLKVTVVATSFTAAITGPNFASGAASVPAGLGSVTGTITLGAAASAAMNVTISTDASGVTAGTATIAKGATSGTFSLAVPYVALTTGKHITVTLPTSEYAQAANTFDIVSPIASSSFTAAAALTGATASGNGTLHLAVVNPSATVAIPVTIAASAGCTIASGASASFAGAAQDTGNFTVQGSAAGTCTLTGTINSIAYPLATVTTFTVSAPNITSVTSNLLTLGTTTAVDTSEAVTLNGKAFGTTDCSVTSSAPGKATATVATVAGTTGGTVTITGVASGSSNVTVTCGTTNQVIAVTVP